MCYCPTPTLHLNLALTGDGAFLFPLKKTHSVWFISVLNYGDTENVLINHLLLVIPMSYPCHYTNLCPHKPHKHAHTLSLSHTHTHIHTHTSNKHTRTHAHTYTHVHKHTQTHTHVHMHTRTHTHTHSIYSCRPIAGYIAKCILQIKIPVSYSSFIQSDSYQSNATIN